MDNSEIRKLHQAEIIKLLTPYLSLFPHSKVDSLGLVIYAKSLIRIIFSSNRGGNVEAY